MNKHLKAGLIPAGKNEDGEQEWIGTNQEWNKFDKSEDENEPNDEDEESEEPPLKDNVEDVRQHNDYDK